MRLLKQALAALGIVMVVAIFVVLVTPKATHAIVATLVQVVNTSANPVPAQIVNTPARQAVVLRTQITVPDGMYFTDSSFRDSSGFYIVPPGMRLVVESTSGTISIPTGQKPLHFPFFVTVNGVQGSLQPVPIFANSFNNQDTYQWLTQSTTYADPGTRVDVVCDRTPYNSGYEFCDATLSGHLESIN